MTTQPHPTQVRSACERCRRQKLKCSRQQGVESSEPCARCTRLGFFCEAGSQRKIGRPGKTSGTNSAVSLSAGTGSAAISSLPSPIEVFTSEESSPAVLPGTTNQAGETEPFLDSLQQDSTWQQVFGDTDTLLGTTSGTSLTLPTPPHLLSIDQTFSTVPRTLSMRPSETAFESLSKVNSQLHTISLSLAESWPFEGMCQRPLMEGLPDMAIFQVAIQALQDYLTTIKTIHRQVGLNKPNIPPGTRSEVSGNWHSAFGAEHHTYKQPKLDVATTFLIVSCFVQLIKICENLLNMFEVFLRFTIGETLINEMLTFAGVVITDFTTQVSMFAEMVRHILLQINVILGIPGSSRLTTVWTGLLADTKDQELLKRELTTNAHPDWSERPRKVLAGIDRLKSTLEEVSMLTQF